MYVRKLTGLIVSILLMGTTGAVAEYPTRPITYVIPFAPGGAADHAGRLLADGLAQSLNSPVVVENRPGANGIIGTTLVAKARADGYTLLHFNSTIVLNSLLYKETTYDPVKDFRPIAFVASQPYLIAVSNHLPVKTLDELIALAKEKNGRLTYATGGTAHLLVGELLQKTAGITLTHVPYDSTSLALPDVISGRVDALIIAAYTAKTQIDNIRPLATTGAKRAALLPDVPTLKDLGYKDFVVEGWIGIAAPANTPDAVAGKLNGTVKTFLEKPETTAAFASAGFDVGYLPEAEFAKVIREGVARDRAVLKEAGIEPK